MTTLEVPTEPAIAPQEKPTRVERIWEDWLFNALAVLLVIGFFISAAIYLVPAHPGVDQNGYLVGGRMLAENLTMRMQPTLPGTNGFDPHQFVGRMWVGADLGTPNERYYPKYPIGLPALYAVALWIGGEIRGPLIAYWINPIAMSLAVAATFLLVRQIASSFWAFCAAVIFASSPVIMGLTTVPNSHATAACFTSWGMYLLIRWWKAGGRWRGMIAGLLLGYAVTIRYTEGLLLLPMLIVIAMRLNWREALWGLAGWAIPVGLLVAYNWAAMGHITGYDGTNESSGFSWQYAADNWEGTIRQLGTIALFFVFPFSILGLVVMLLRDWRMGVILAAWIVPCMVTYTFYYWAPDPQLQQGAFVGYMRFFVTIFPPLLMTAFWLMDHVTKALQTPTAPPWALRTAQICFGVVPLIALAVNLENSTFAAENDQQSRLMLKFNADSILATAPAGSVIFAQDGQLFHHLQFLRDYKLYTMETFNKPFVNDLPRMDPDEPQGWDPGRRDALYNRLKDLSPAQLNDDGRRIITAALESGSRVFFLRPGGAGDFARFTKQDQFITPVVAAWVTPVVRLEGQDNLVRPWPRRRLGARAARQATNWQIMEVKKKPPPPPAPPRPATRPATTRRVR